MHGLLFLAELFMGEKPQQTSLKWINFESSDFWVFTASFCVCTGDGSIMGSIQGMHPVIMRSQHPDRQADKNLMFYNWRAEMSQEHKSAFLSSISLHGYSYTFNLWKSLQHGQIQKYLMLSTAPAGHKDSISVAAQTKIKTSSKCAARRKGAKDIFHYYSGNRVLRLPLLLVLRQSLISLWDHFIKKYLREQTNPPSFCLFTQMKYYTIK